MVRDLLNRAIVFSSVEIPVSGIEGSKAYTGLNSLLGDASKLLMIVGPVIGVIALIYLAIRKMMADEHESKLYTKRMIGVVICAAVVLLAGAIIGIIKKLFWRIRRRKYGLFSRDF